LRDKISGILLNEIQLSKEFEQFIKEKYSNNIIFNNRTNKININSNKTKDNYDNGDNFHSSKSINEFSIYNFFEVIMRRETKNLSNENIENIFDEKIEFLKIPKKEIFVENEMKYPETIEKLFNFIKEIQEDKVVKSNNNNDNHQINNDGINNKNKNLKFSNNGNNNKINKGKN
jgi:hypothetical protein